MGLFGRKNAGGYKFWLAANLLEFVSDAYDTRLYDNDNQEQRLPGYRVDAQTDAAIRYIDSVKDSPFFLFLSYLEPHHQNHTDAYPAPDGYEENYRARWTPPDLTELGGSSQIHLSGYYGMVKRLDEALGRLLDALKSMGIMENTVVLFTSDHGNHFKTRNVEYKRSCHESSVRVPMAVVGPEFQGGGEVRQPVSLVDIPPTLLGLAGTEKPSKMHGESLLPLVRRTGERSDQVFIQISESQIGRALRSSRWKYCVTAPEDVDPWDHAYSDVYHEQFLYDLDNDPYELHNLIEYRSHKEIAEQLRADLLDKIEAVEGRRPTIKPPAEYKQYGQLSGSDNFPYLPEWLEELR